MSSYAGGGGSWRWWPRAGRRLPWCCPSQGCGARLRSSTPAAPRCGSDPFAGRQVGVRPPGPAVGPNPMAPIPHVLREYALVADGERGALIGPQGEIAWLCFPGWEDPALFAGLIGGAGAYTVSPRTRHVWGGYYEPGTLIWRSRWVSREGIVECREALALPSHADRAVLLRRIEVLDGHATIAVELDLRGDYGRRGLDELSHDGDWHARAGDVHARWSGAPGLRFELDLDKGDHHDLVLVLQRGSRPEPVDPDAAWVQTEREWQARVPALDDSLAPRD